MIAAVAMTVPMTLVHLSTVDIAIIVFYFGLVLTIGRSPTRFARSTTTWPSPACRSRSR